MFDEYSIEQRAKLIPNKNTKGYFAEVVSCYNSGNYRSAVVMLWSVAVCDLLFKLKELDEIYDDIKAKKILAEIKSRKELNSLILQKKRICATYKNSDIFQHTL